MKKFILVPSLLAAGTMLANAETGAELNTLIEKWITETSYTAGDDFSLSFTVNSVSYFQDRDSIIKLDDSYYLMTQETWYAGLSSSATSMSNSTGGDPGTAESANSNPVNTYTSEGALYGWISKAADGTRPQTTIEGATIVVSYDSAEKTSTVKLLLASGGQNIVNMSNYVLDVNDFEVNTSKGWTFSNIAIPEPSAFGMLAGLGALALVASRRRRR